MDFSAKPCIEPSIISNFCFRSFSLVSTVLSINFREWKVRKIIFFFLRPQRSILETFLWNAKVKNASDFIRFLCFQLSNIIVLLSTKLQSCYSMTTLCSAWAQRKSGRLDICLTFGGIEQDRDHLKGSNESWMSWLHSIRSSMRFNDSSGSYGLRNRSDIFPRPPC